MIGELAERIRRDGPISVADYMNTIAEAYYARGDVFGADGDFITAPEISQTFGELIGLWCAVVWQNMGSPKDFHLVECGPGRGTLMSDLLRAASRVPGFSPNIHLVEHSAALKVRQRTALKDHTVTWHQDLSSVPPGPMILVGNEFLDALPIRQFEKTTDGWAERYIGLKTTASWVSFSNPRPSSARLRPSRATFSKPHPPSRPSSPPPPRASRNRAARAADRLRSQSHRHR